MSDVFEWPEGKVLVRTHVKGGPYYQVIDGNGEDQGAFKLGTRSLLFCSNWNPSRKINGFADATPMWPRFPKWVRDEINRLRGWPARKD